MFVVFSHPLFFCLCILHGVQASNKSQLSRRYSNTNLVYRNAWLDYSRYYIFIRCDGAYQTNPIHQANVVNKYSWYVLYLFFLSLNCLFELMCVYAMRFLSLQLNE